MLRVNKVISKGVDKGVHLRLILSCSVLETKALMDISAMFVHIMCKLFISEYVIDNAKVD